MLTKDDCVQVIKKFRAKHALDASDENVIATIHLMNTHGIDIHAALDQSSRSSNDNGIDAWYFDEVGRALFIYQSKLTESKALALKGLTDLDRGRQWLEQIIIDGTAESVPENHCLFNLYTRVSAVRGSLKKIYLVLISPFEKDELEDCSQYEDFGRELTKSRLNTFVHDKLGGKIFIDASAFNLEQAIPRKVKVYPIPTIPDAQIELRRNAHLDLAFVTLQSLVELYRQRGDVLFDKNVRLSLMRNKEARERLLNPMESTLDLITSGKVSPSIFPFYHIGVTIAANASNGEDTNTLNLEAPSIINGCQTIVIANEYLKKLEKQKNDDALEIFRKIKVIAKVVVGTNNEELKEITNSNNRQNPIENWQLFSNESIHIEIEATLKDVGVFYERQKGKFDSVMKNADSAKYYYATNGTYLRVVDLGQIIALSRKNLQWAAKPSDIFINKDSHDKAFDRSIPQYPRDIIFVSNLFRAMKRGLNKYLELPAHANSNAPLIFKKSLVRHHVYRLALMYFYQNGNKAAVREDFSSSLYKIASPRLVDEVQGFYLKVVTKTKKWYTEESKDLSIEIAKRKLDTFFDGLGTELGVDPEGAMPFSAGGIDGYAKPLSPRALITEV